MKKTRTLAIIALLFLSVTLAASGPALAGEKDGARSIQLPVMKFDLADGPDRDKVQGYCGVCHGAEYIPMQPKMSKAQWTGTVTKMIKAFGAPIPQEDADKIVNYLATAYGTGK